MKYNPPVVAGKDDVTGEPLQQRPEDQPETIMQRLLQYRRQAAEVRSTFPSDVWMMAEANGNVEAVRNNVFLVLDQLRRMPRTPSTVGTKP